MKKLVYLALLLGLTAMPMAALAQEGTPNPAAVPPVTDVVEAPAVAEPAPAPAEVVDPAPAPAADVAPAPAEEVKPDAGPTPPAEEVKPPMTDGDAVDVAMKAVAAARGGEWTLFAGLLLMLLIYVFNRFGMAAKIGSKAVPWVTAAFGIVGSVGWGMANGELWYVALIHGFFMSATAISLWELVIKHLTMKKADGTPRTA